MIKRNALKFLGVLLAVSFVAGSFSACGKANEVNVNYSSSDLNIYKDKSWAWLDNVTAQYKETNPGIGVNTIEFSDYTAYAKKLTPELYAGKGPDVIIARSGEVRDLIKNGALADLTGIVPEAFDMQEFGGNIQDIGIVDNKRYFFVADYKLPVFYSAKTLLDGLALPNDTFLSWENFTRLAREYKSKGKYLVGGDARNFVFYMMNSSGIEYIDYTKRQSKLKDNEEKIEKLLESYKNDILPIICPDEEMKKFKYPIDAMKSGLFLLNFIDEVTYKRLWTNNSMIRSKVDSDMVLIPFPSDGTGAKKYSDQIVAINKNCKHKNEAFDYIKILLPAEKEDHIIGITTSKKLKEEQWTRYGINEKTGKTAVGMGNENGIELIKTVLLPKGLFSKMEELTQKAQIVNYDSNVQDIIQYRINQYIKGSKSVKDTIKNIDNAISKILKE